MWSMPNNIFNTQSNRLDHETIQIVNGRINCRVICSNEHECYTFDIRKSSINSSPCGQTTLFVYRIYGFPLLFLPLSVYSCQYFDSFGLIFSLFHYNTLSPHFHSTLATVFQTQWSNPSKIWIFGFSEFCLHFTVINQWIGIIFFIANRKWHEILQ